MIIWTILILNQKKKLKIILITVKKKKIKNDKNMCDIFSTLEECKEAVMNLKPNKSVVLDGIPNAFIRAFGKIYFRCFIVCYMKFIIAT